MTMCNAKWVFCSDKPTKNDQQLCRVSQRNSVFQFIVLALWPVVLEATDGQQKPTVRYLPYTKQEKLASWWT